MRGCRASPVCPGASDEINYILHLSQAFHWYKHLSCISFLCWDIVQNVFFTFALTLTLTLRILIWIHVTAHPCSILNTIMLCSIGWDLKPERSLRAKECGRIPRIKIIIIIIIITRKHFAFAGRMRIWEFLFALTYYWPDKQVFNLVTAPNSPEIIS